MSAENFRASTTGFDFDKFDAEWTKVAREICQAVYVNEGIQKIKANLIKNQYLTPEENGEFIDTCNRIKYELIYNRYGKEGSEGYRKFSQDWAQWFKLKGVESQKNRDQRSSVDHILFGSTPDPGIFLLHFEEEMLGSMK